MFPLIPSIFISLRLLLPNPDNSWFKFSVPSPLFNINKVGKGDYHGHINKIWQVIHVLCVSISSLSKSSQSLIQNVGKIVHVIARIHLEITSALTIIHLTNANWEAVQQTSQRILLVILALLLVLLFLRRPILSFSCLIYAHCHHMHGLIIFFYFKDCLQ